MRATGLLSLVLTVSTTFHDDLDSGPKLTLLLRRYEIYSRFILPIDFIYPVRNTNDSFTIAYAVDDLGEVLFKS